MNGAWDAMYIYDGEDETAANIGEADNNTIFTASNSSGCLTAVLSPNSTFDAPGWGAQFRCVRIYNASVSNTDNCDGHGTGCSADDTYSADITVYFASIPASGTLTFTGSNLAGVPPSVPVSSLSGGSYTFYGVPFFTNTSTPGIQAIFSEEPDEGFSLPAFWFGSHSPCSQSTEVEDVVTDGFTCFSATTFSFDGTYNTFNGNPLPQWSAFDATLNETIYIRYKNPTWVFVGENSGEFAETTPYFSTNYYQGSHLPCNNWKNTCTAEPGEPTLANGCGWFHDFIILNSTISSITTTPFSACNGNATCDPADDYFTTDVTVAFVYAPGVGTLTLKRGTTVLATQDAEDMGCATSWTFENVHLPSDGAAVVLTAAFSPEVSFTSSSLGIAPAGRHDAFYHRRNNIFSMHHAAIKKARPGVIKNTRAVATSIQAMSAAVVLAFGGFKIWQHRRKSSQ